MVDGGGGGGGGDGDGDGDGGCADDDGVIDGDDNDGDVRCSSPESLVCLSVVVY